MWLGPAIDTAATCMPSHARPAHEREREARARARAKLPISTCISLQLAEVSGTSPSPVSSLAQLEAQPMAVIQMCGAAMLLCRRRKLPHCPYTVPRHRRPFPNLRKSGWSTSRPKSSRRPGAPWCNFVRPSIHPAAVPPRAAVQQYSGAQATCTRSPARGTRGHGTLGAC